MTLGRKIYCVIKKAWKQHKLRQKNLVEEKAWLNKKIPNGTHDQKQIFKICISPCQPGLQIPLIVTAQWPNGHFDNNLDTMVFYHQTAASAVNFWIYSCSSCEIPKSRRKKFICSSWSCKMQLLLPGKLTGLNSRSVVAFFWSPVAKFLAIKEYFF